MTLPEFVNQHDIPIQWLAKKAGLKRTQVSNWVNGTHPPPLVKLKQLEDTIKRIGSEFCRVKFDH